jgi:hypothetical protein
MKIAIATCSRLPEPDPDERLLLDALEAEGARVRMLAWDDGDGAAAPDELVVLRSTWNYYEDVDRFLAWTDRTARTTHLLNPAAMVRTNARKTYLGDLAECGIDVVPTVFVRRGETCRASEIAQQRRWHAFVVKPVVSAGSFKTRRFDAATLDDAQAFLDATTAERDMMMQRWIPTVESYGERALVWIDGELSHAVRKSPRFSGGEESVTEVDISSDERTFAERVLAGRIDGALYARVDVIKDDEGVLRLMELELIEPSLFLKQCPNALLRLVSAIVSRARGLATT